MQNSLPKSKNSYITFQPTPGKLVVRRAMDRSQFESHTSLETPDIAQTTPPECEVIAVGEDCPGMVVGGTVLVGAFSGVAIQYWGSTYLLVLFDEVMGSIEVRTLIHEAGDDQEE